MLLPLLVSVTLPEHVPVPVSRPEPEAKLREEPAVPPKPLDDSESKDEAEVPPPPPIEKENAGAYAACLTELQNIGVVFQEVSSIDDGNGCGIDKPISVHSLGNGVDIKPDGTMRCETALRLAQWIESGVVPAAKVALPGEALSAINQASAYVCRKRNGADEGKISEHARGNAVDIASFTFRSGKTFSIEPRMKDSTLEGAFQRAITASACLYFTTVLDPGSDAAHETHLHLDVIKRKGSYRYCW